MSEEPQEVASSSSSPQHPDDSDSTDDSMIGNRIIDALNRQVAARSVNIRISAFLWSSVGLFSQSVIAAMEPCFHSAFSLHTCSPRFFFLKIS